MDKLSPELRTYLQLYKWQHIDPVPWAVPSKPLSQMRVGLVVTACMTMADQPPFDAEKPDNDPSIRYIPSTEDPADLVNTYPAQGFDHAGLQADPNLLVPIDRLREMERAREIGELAPRIVSLCGHLPKPAVLMAESAPAIAKLFKGDGVDTVIHIPA
jgi:D-proline reductase (dithiol) PrdB